MLFILLFACLALLSLVGLWVGHTKWSEGRRLAALALVVVVLALSFWAALGFRHDGYLALAIAIGGFVGVCEIVSRYRDEPYIALVRNRFGPTYILLNGVFAGLAYLLLNHYGEPAGATTGSSDRLQLALLGGLGSAVIMRSRLFTVKSPAGEDVAVGPDALIATLLRCIDRGIDRSRSVRRQSLAFKEAMALPPEKVEAAIAFVHASIGAFQNLSEAEQRDLRAILKRVDAELGGDPRLRFMVISFALLNISGEESYAQLMLNLHDYLRNGDPFPPQSPPQARAQPQPNPAAPPPPPPGPDPVTAEG